MRPIRITRKSDRSGVKRVGGGKKTILWSGCIVSGACRVAATSSVHWCRKKKHDNICDRRQQDTDGQRAWACLSALVGFCQNLKARGLPTSRLDARAPRFSAGPLSRCSKSRPATPGLTPPRSTKATGRCEILERRIWGGVEAGGESGRE